MTFDVDVTIEYVQQYTSKLTVILFSQKLAEEDLETLTRDLKGYTEKIDTGRQQLSDKHKEDMTTLQKELEEVQAQIKKVQGKLDAPPVLS